VIVRSIIALAVVFATSLAGAEVTLQEFSWSKLRHEGRLVSGQVVAADSTTPFETLVVENTESSPATFTVLVIEDPGITSSNYAVRGRIAYEGVEDKGYSLEGGEWKLRVIEGVGHLEMWSYFPDGTRDFSRAIRNSGPLQYRKGTSDWREFEVSSLPGKKRKRPDRLIINVVLPGKGKFRLGPLRLVEYEAWGVRAWWRDEEGVMMGGAGVVCLVTLSLVVWRLSSRGLARGFVFAMTGTMILLGAALVGVGIAALALSQPFGVVFFPLALGVATAVVNGVVLAMVIRKRHEENELRKIAARDV
jgi:hypothetical protein